MGKETHIIASGCCHHCVQRAPASARIIRWWPLFAHERILGMANGEATWRVPWLASNSERAVTGDQSAKAFTPDTLAFAKSWTEKSSCRYATICVTMVITSQFTGALRIHSYSTLPGLLYEKKNKKETSEIFSTCTMSITMNLEGTTIHFIAKYNEFIPRESVFASWWLNWVPTTVNTNKWRPAR